MLRSKIIHLKETYKFFFKYFLEKRTVFILLKKTLLKIKSCGFRPNSMQVTKKILCSKIVHLKEIYNFGFDHFLIKRTVFDLIVKNVYKNKIVRFKKIYKFYFNHLLIKCTVFVLNVKNIIKNQKLNFSDKLCDIQKKMLRNKIVRFKKMYTNLTLTIF